MTFENLLALVHRDKSIHICIDSRTVTKGDCFIAINGAEFDGYDFISQALSKGAKYIVTEKLYPSATAEIVTVADSAEAAALLAQAAKDNPASKLTNLSVTGTNGKTTVAFLVQSVMRNAGKKCGLIGTIFYDTCEEIYPAPLTTPDVLTIAEATEKMVKAGAEYMVIEASSHALSQNRLAGIDFKAAAFTNLTGDHLDYHKTEENYLEAKSRLFENLSPEAIAILNSESSHAKTIAKTTEAKILWYGIETQADIKADIESADITGTVFTLSYAGQKEKVKTSLLGRYNVSNCLAAAGLCMVADFDLKAVADGLCALKAVPGRLERVDWNSDFSVIIDYAHTDDALKNVLSTLRPLCKGKLILVFGCGGDRDITKRPRMAKIAEEFADFIVITSDNPRNEEPEDIIDQIVTGFTNPTAETIFCEFDRKEAIALAIRKADKGDMILIAGKGHEDYQIIGKEKISFSDKEVALKYLRELK